MGYLNHFSENVILINHSDVILVCQILLFLNNKLLWSIADASEATGFNQGILCSSVSQALKMKK